MSRILQVYKKYKISNAEVRTIPPKFQTSELTVQWVISSRTVIDKIANDDEVMPVKFCYSKFTDLVQYMDDRTKSVGESFNALLLICLRSVQSFSIIPFFVLFADVLGVVISALEKKTVIKNSKQSDV